MTEPTPSLAEPATRGRLRIADRVVERIATHSAAGIAGATRSGSTLTGVVGRQFPKASAQIAGSRVRISVDVAVLWPHSLPQVTAAVRDAVAAEVHRLAGMQVDAVDVTAARILHEPDDQSRRLR